MNRKLGFEKLFEPSKIGKMNLVNRLVMPSMGNNYGSEDGYVTQRLIDYYTERAKGGPGLIITEMVSMDFPMGRRGAHQLRIDDDSFIKGLSHLTRQVHKRNRKIAIQLCHAGILAGTGNSGLLPLAPSAAQGLTGIKSRELAESEIEGIIHRFVDAAMRAQAANFDGIEVHAAHGYLLAHFLSPAWNKRKDRYGGNTKNRSRILVEIISRIRNALGPDYPLWCRMNGGEFGIEGGLTITESKNIACLVEKAGCDAIHVSAFGYGSYYGYNRGSTNQPRGNLVSLAAEIKKVVSVPVITVGRIDLPLGEKLIRESKVDLVAIGRGQIADPHLIKKSFAGRLDEIRPCISCNVCVDDLITRDASLHCSVNPWIGKERESKIQPAQKIKRVLVIGGGPGGMEAAIVAALRGHKVTLYDKQTQLGGKLILAAIPPYKNEIKLFTNYLITRINKLGVNVELGKTADLNTITKHKPDVVILAAGATPVVPKIPGIDNAEVMFAEDVLTGKEVGQKVVIIGGGLVGCETCEYLVEKGKTLTICEMLDEIAVGVNISIKIGLIDRMTVSGVTMLTGAKCIGINKKGIVLTTRQGNQTVAADTVVLAVGARSNVVLLESIKELVPEIHLVGDCVEPRRIIDAVSEGCRIGLVV